MMTTFSLGILYSLSAFPRIRSDSPLEYVLAVSKVLIPFSYLTAMVVYVNRRRTERAGTEHSRELDMLHSLFLSQQPFLPCSGAIAHATWNRVPYDTAD